jgi:O-antigen/teichoic acid export membrane protein
VSRAATECEAVSVGGEPKASPPSRLRGLLRGGGVVIATQAAITGGAFVRNLIVARFVTKADFGIASLIAMWLSIGELFGDMGVGRCLVRSPERDERGFLGTGHALTVGLFASAGLALVLGGGEAARLMGDNMEPYAWAFRAVGVILWIRAFTHCGAWQTQRSMRFGPMAIAQAVSQGAGVLLAAPVALWLKDYRAMVVLAAVNVLAYVIATHVVSPQKYELRFIREFGAAFWRFGAPLVADGLLMFLLFHGERVILSRTQTPDVLGAYSAVFQLAFAPTLLLANTAMGLGIPELAHAPDERVRNKRYAVACGLIGACVLGLACLLILGGGPLIKVVFGSKYEGSWAIMAAVAAGQGFRILRIAPTVRAMERGDTLLPFICNLVRAASLIPAWWGARQGWEVWQVLSVGVVGEAFSAMACTVGVRWRWKAPAWPNLAWMGAYAVVASVCVLVPSGTGSEDRMMLLPIGIGAGVAVGALGVALTPGVREELHRLARLIRARRGGGSGPRA